MHIKKLHLVNYRNHADTEINFGDAKFIIVRGRNASGKTSIAESISVNTTGTTVSLGTQGNDFVSKIKQGEKKAVVTCDIQGQHLLKNVVTLNVNTSGRTTSTDCVDDPDNNKVVTGFKKFLSDRKNALLVACNTEFFNSLDQKGKTNLLAKLVLPARYDFPKDKTEAVNDLLDTPIDFNGEPFDVIASSYKQLYKLRETVNRQVKEFVIPDALPKPSVDSESLQTQLTGVREQRTKLQTDRDAAVAKANEVEVKRGRLQTKIEGLRDSLDKGKKRLASLEDEILSAEKIKDLTEISSKELEVKALIEQHSGFLGAIRTINAQINKLKGVSEQGATCPVCEQNIDSAKIATLISDLQKESADADTKLQELDKQIEAIGDVSAAKESLRKNESLVKEKSDLETSLTETVKAGKAAKAEQTALGEAVNATLPFDEPLATLQAQEDGIVEQLRPVIAAEERAKERERLTEQLTKLQKKASTLDTLVKWFDKDGIKATLIKKYIGGFEEKVNSVLAAWGYKASLSPDLSGFDVTTSNGYVGPVKELSGSEEHRFKVAFQCAVSIAAGINFVVIDEVDYLGEDIRIALYSTVYGLIQSKQLEQAILIGFSLDKTVPPKDKRAPGSKYFYVSEGTVEELV